MAPQEVRNTLDYNAIPEHQDFCIQKNVGSAHFDKDEAEPHVARRHGKC